MRLTHGWQEPQRRAINRSKIAGTGDTTIVTYGLDHEELCGGED